MDVVTNVTNQIFCVREGMGWACPQVQYGNRKSKKNSRERMIEERERGQGTKEVVLVKEEKLKHLIMKRTDGWEETMRAFIGALIVTSGHVPGPI